jgi:hypothetical protein
LQHERRFSVLFRSASARGATFSVRPVRANFSTASIRSLGFVLSNDGVVSGAAGQSESRWQIAACQLPQRIPGAKVTIAGVQNGFRRPEFFDLDGGMVDSKPLARSSLISASTRLRSNFHRK